METNSAPFKKGDKVRQIHIAPLLKEGKALLDEKSPLYEVIDCFYDKDAEKWLMDLDYKPIIVDGKKLLYSTQFFIKVES